MAGEDYKGGRDADSLKAFVVDKLEVKCSVQDPVDCTDKEKKYIDKMKSKTEEERKAQIDRLDKMKGASMTNELKTWLMQRLRILNGLNAGSDEL